MQACASYHCARTWRLCFARSLFDRKWTGRAGIAASAASVPQALSEVARIRLEEDRPEHALGLFQRVLAEDGIRENIHREVMKLYITLGRRSEAAAHYQRLVDDLKRDGKTPAPETTAFYQSIMAQ